MNLKSEGCPFRDRDTETLVDTWLRALVTDIESQERSHMSKSLRLGEDISLHPRLSVERTLDILWVDSNEK